MRQRHWALLLIGLALTLAAPAPSWARAGGGGGGGGFGGGGFGGGSGPANRPYGSGGAPSGEGLWVLIPIFVLGLPPVLFGPDVAIRHARRRARRREASTVQQMTAGRPGGLQEFAALDGRVRECFFKVQDSWRSRDVRPSRALVSDALYRRHWRQLEEMRHRGHRNRIEDLVLSDVRVVRLERGPDGRAARCAARIEASARDWVTDVARRVVVAGDPDEQRRFVEYWHFSHHPARGWVLDEISRGEWALPKLPRWVLGGGEWAVKDSNLQP